MTNQEYKEEFGFRLKKRMRNLGMTQKELAERIGVTEATLSRYVSGERFPEIDILRRLFNELKLKGREGWLINF